MIPIITVIVPIHNEEKYIDRLMESLQDQTHRRLQIILVDGGSTDSSPQICDRWASRWNMGPDTNMGIVEVIHTADKGVSVSRNTGLSHATGEYVTFVDGDDWLDKEALEKMLKGIQDTGAELCGCDFKSIFPDPENDPETDAKTADSAKTVDGNEDKTSEVSVFSPDEFIAGHILAGDVHVWGRLYKRELIGTLRFRDGLTIGEDMLFVTEYAGKCTKIAHMTYRGYNYFRNPHGAMLKPFSPAAMDQIRCFEYERTLLEKLAPDLSFGDGLRSNMLIGVMLTAGRIAVLDKDIRKDEEHKGYIKKLKSTVKEYKSRGAMKRLDRGYRLKVRLFKFSPGLYLGLYHRYKGK